MTTNTDMTTIIVERSGTRGAEIWKARIKDDEDASAVFPGKTAAEAVGWLVIHLGFSLKLRVIQNG